MKIAITDRNNEINDEVDAYEMREDEYKKKLMIKTPLKI